MSKATQTERILAYIEEFGSITQLDALKDLGVMRLASRITDLKRRGYLISKEIKKSKNRYNETVRYAEYRLVENGGNNNG